MAATMKISMRRLGGAQFEARSPQGQRCLVDGPPDVGGRGEGMRPMEMVLVGLAGCSAVDVLHILQKGRHQIGDLDIDVEAERADAVPAVFTRIHLRFVASGDFDLAKLQRAADLSMEKYCSVATMLAPTVEITHEVALKGT